MTNILSVVEGLPVEDQLQIFWQVLAAKGSSSRVVSILNDLYYRKHINSLVLKVVLLALKEFKPLCKGQVVLMATDNTTVVVYISKKGE